MSARPKESLWQKEAGRYSGRKRTLADMQVREARERLETGESKAALAHELGIARTTLYAALSRDI